MSDIEKKKAECLRFLLVGRLAEPAPLQTSAKGTSFARLKMKMKNPKGKFDTQINVISFGEDAEGIASTTGANDTLQLTGDIWKRYSKEYGEEITFVARSCEVVEKYADKNPEEVAAAQSAADFDDIEF